MSKKTVQSVLKPRLTYKVNGKLWIEGGDEKFLQNRSNNSDNKSLNLSQQEKKNIIAFLNMLTDSAFISNKNFSNPFTN